MARKKIYFDTRSEAKKRLSEMDPFERNCRDIMRVPHGPHKGKFVVCSYIGYINEMYYL